MTPATHLCCSACRVRFEPRWAIPDPVCPRCGAPLAALSPRAALGYRIAAPVRTEWRPAHLDALADAVAVVRDLPPRT
jgi:hypothetical protein